MNTEAPGNFTGASDPRILQLYLGLCGWLSFEKSKISQNYLGHMMLKCLFIRDGSNALDLAHKLVALLPSVHIYCKIT
jgi:hypothetical protein